MTNEQKQAQQKKTDVQLMKRLDNFHEFMPKFLPVIERTWSANIALNLPKFEQMAIHIIQRQPKIMDCEALSIMGAFATCAEYGLYPDDLRGHVYLVPRWDKDIGMYRCNFMLGYKGYVACYRRNPMAAPGKSVESERVYEGDEIYIEKGLEPKLKHVPDLEAQEKKDRKLKLVYSILHYREGPPDFDHVFNWQIEEIRQNHSDAKDSGFSPWNSKSDLVVSWMQKKTSLKQVLKLSPALDETLAMAVANDDRMEVGLPQRLPATLDAETQALVANMVAERATTQVAVTADIKPSSGTATALDQFMAEKKAQKGEGPKGDGDNGKPANGEKPPAPPEPEKAETKGPEAKPEPAETKGPEPENQTPKTDKERKAANEAERAKLQEYVKANLYLLPGDDNKVLTKLTDLRKQQRAIEAIREAKAAEEDTERPFDDPDDPGPASPEPTAAAPEPTNEPDPTPPPNEPAAEPEPGTAAAWEEFMKTSD